MTQEKIVRPKSGYGALAISLGFLLITPVLFLIIPAMEGSPIIQAALVLAGAATGLTGLVSLFGLVAIAPNEARVFLLFGEYVGTAKESGFYWVNPFYSKKHISLRVRNFETGSKNVPATHDAAGKVLEKTVAYQWSPLESERPRWQPDRHFSGGGLESRQYG